jgi:hypothetical protein
MAMGYQQNNFSPMGQGQPTQNKDAKRQRPNFMTDVMGMQEDEPVIESVSPGIPAAQMGATLSPPQVNPNPTNNTLPVRQPQSQPQTTPPPPSTTGVPQTWSAQVFQGFQPLQRMEGFDWKREQNIGKSAKDAFAFLSQEAAKRGQFAPLDNDTPEAKAAYAQWFNQNIAPGMNQLGHKIDWVNGDKFGFSNWQGKFNVDYGRGAGARGGALAWQAEDANALPTRAPANDIYAQAQQQLVAPTQSDNLEELLMALMSQNQELI